MAVAQVRADRGKDRRQVGLKEFRDRASAVHHVLPDDHPDPVAVVVPAGGLYFDMLAEHVEAQLLHLFDVEDERFVSRRRHQGLRPVALVEDPVEEIRRTVQEKTGLSVLVRPDAERTHGEVAFDPVAVPAGTCLDAQRIQNRALRAPQRRIRNRDARFHAGLQRICDSCCS